LESFIAYEPVSGYMLHQRRTRISAMKTPSPGEAKQGMTFDRARGKNTEKQAIQNLVAAQLKIRTQAGYGYN